MLQKIGFIGLGTVGRHMAANLAKGSYELTVFDTELAVVQELAAAGAKAASSASEAAKGRDLVIAIVPEGEELGPLFFGDAGILAGIDSGTILADMGSHSLETTMKLSEECAKKNVPYLDAPVWGSKDHAVNGLMTIITAGDPSLAGKCREPFSFFGLNTIHVGQIGDATKMKFIVNLVQAELVQVLAEGLVFGEKMGFNADKILEVLDTRGVASPLFHQKGHCAALLVEKRRCYTTGIEYLQYFVGVEPHLFSKHQSFCQNLYQLGLNKINDKFHLGGIADLADMDRIKSEKREWFTAFACQGRVAGGDDRHEPVDRVVFTSPYRRIQIWHIFLCALFRQFHRGFKR